MIERLKQHFFLFCLIAMTALHLPAEASSDRSDENIQTVLKADLAGQANPEGVMVLFELYRRWTGMTDQEFGVPRNYVQAGFGMNTSPAYGRVNVNLEWQPVLFANLRVQYDLYRYYGANSSLLSFASGQASFKEDEIEAMEGQEQSGYGNRFLIRPTLYAKAGRFLIVNRTDLAYLHFNGQGPYFLDWTYETLLTDGDHVVENRTDFLVDAKENPGKAKLLLGPYYEIMHASSSGMKRSRAGGMIYWESENTRGSFRLQRIYAQAGVYLHDRNRESEAYVVIGTGFSFDM